jgi:hypothetical protein
MLPSPSLGPPLLSASWSPALPCGIELDDDEVDLAGAGLGAAAGTLVAGVLALVGVLDCPPAGCDVADAPQPANRAVSSASPAADRVRVNDMTGPFLFVID